MATCIKCGTTLADGANYCPACGHRAGTSPRVLQPADPGIPPNIAALLCYIAWPITCVLFMILQPYNKDRLVRFHAFQSLFLGLFSVGLAIVLLILSTVLGFIPVVGWLLDFLLWAAYTLGILCLAVFLMYKAYCGEQYEVPWVGKMAAQQSAR